MPVHDSEQQASGPSPKPEANKLEELAAVRELWEKHGVPVLVGAGIAVIALLGFMLYRAHTQSARDAATMHITSARTVDDLRGLITRCPSAPVASLAALKIAKAYFDSGHYEQALQEYETIKTRYSHDSFAIEAAELGRAHCLEARGKIQEALEIFGRFASEHPVHFLTAQAIFGQGRCLEALGRLDEARTLYEDFIATRPDSPWKGRAMELLEVLNRRLAKNKAGDAARSPAAPVVTNAAPVPAS